MMKVKIVFGVLVLFVLVVVSSCTIGFHSDFNREKTEYETGIFRTENIEIDSLVTKTVIKSGNENKFYYYHDLFHTDINYIQNYNGFKVEEIKKYNSIINPSRSNLIQIIVNDFVNLLKLESSTGGIDVIGIESSKGIINSSTGNIFIDDSFFNELTLTNSTGRVIIQNSYVNFLICNASTSSLVLRDGGVYEAKINRSTGSVEFNNVRIIGNVDIETSTGNVNFYNVNLNDYRIIFSSSTGYFKAPGIRFNKQGVYGNGPKVINIRTSTGNVIVH